MSFFARVKFSWRRIAPLAFIAALAFAAGAARAQLPTKPPPPPPDPPPAQSNGQAPPPAAGESSSKNTPDGLSSTSPPKSAGLPGDAEPLPPFNPLEAEKDVEVGQYYVRIGKYDAAIDRFIDATRAVPTYALPWQLMGQAYEKKGDLAKSVSAFQKYLQLYPHSPERKKIEDHIDDMQKKIDQQKHGKK
jgi:eukaryotic-like serine/threonine-protein kinase